MNLIAQLINGISTGSIYALVALGYTMVYGIVKLINFAHGDIIMVGSYICFFAMSLYGSPFGVAILLSAVFCAVFGMVIERLAYKPLRNAPRISALITAIGVSLFIQNAFAAIFSPTPIGFPNVFNSESITLMAFENRPDIKISVASLATLLVSICLMVLLTLFVKKTKTGKAMRAVSEDGGAAALMGINHNHTIALTFAIGSALAAIGGAMYSAEYQTINPFMGSMLGIKAFVAAVLGGIGIIPGAMLGGFLMGIAESLAKSVNSQLADAVVFGILIIVLRFKPAGLLGKHIREKV